MRVAIVGLRVGNFPGPYDGAVVDLCVGCRRATWIRGNRVDEERSRDLDVVAMCWECSSIGTWRNPDNCAVLWVNPDELELAHRLRLWNDDAVDAPRAMATALKWARNPN